MLSTHTAFMITDEGHHEWINKIIEPLLKVMVVIPWDTAIQMQVTVTYVAVTHSHDTVLLFLRESRRVFDYLPGCLHTVIVVLWLQGHVIFQTLKIIPTAH